MGEGQGRLETKESTRQESDDVGDREGRTRRHCHSRFLRQFSTQSGKKRSHEITEPRFGRQIVTQATERPCPTI